MANWLWVFVPHADPVTGMYNQQILVTFNYMIIKMKWSMKLIITLKHLAF